MSKPFWEARGANLVCDGRTMVYLMRVQRLPLPDAKKLCARIAAALNEAEGRVAVRDGCEAQRSEHK